MFQIDYQKILNNETANSIVKEVAQKLLKTPYMTIGDFFKSLSNDDVMVLAWMIDRAREPLDSEESMNAARDLVILVEMLAQAEGVIAATEDERYDNVNHFIVMATSDSLFRKGLVEADHSKMSFGPDMKDAVFVWRKTDFS